jgi:hypothetical protein
MRHYIGPFNEVFREALTVRREASILRGWAMPWNEDVPLPRCAPRDQDQERTAMLRRTLQSTDGEMATADAGDDNIQEGNVDQEMADAFIAIDDDSSDEESDNEPSPETVLQCKRILIAIMHSKFYN